MTRHTIEANEKPLLDIFCDKYLFRIPSYQRPYAWTTEQTSELLDDVVTACGDSENVADASPYFLGSIVLIKDPQKAEADTTVTTFGRITVRRKRSIQPSNCKR